MKCRHCGSSEFTPFVDLGAAPPSNSYLKAPGLSRVELWYPLRVSTCERCFLVQTEDFADRGEFFSEDYAYFSSFSDSWLRHAESYVGQMVDRLDLGADSLVAEVASNDGYLLQYVKGAGVPCFGIEPTHNTAEAARRKGIDVVEDFFGADLARRLVADGKAVDLTAANNVLAHVPDINDFVRGFSILLKAGGVATFEFPHLVQLVRHSQFDTIYHEHYSYLSLLAVEAVFRSNGLTVFDVEKLSTHGGSLRVYAQRTDTGARPITAAVEALREEERGEGVGRLDYYMGLQSAAETIAHDLTSFLITARREGKTVAGYGAAAKGNTLLNFAGIRPNLLPFVVDRNPAKQGGFMPGSRIPIVNEAVLRGRRPDYVLILPWNLKEEIMNQLAYVRDWDGEFVTAVPELAIQ